MVNGCSFAPLNSPHTARSLGKGENNVNASVSPLGLEYSRGIAENTDIGIGAEMQFGPLYTGWMKHSFVNNSKGGSTALLGGIFYGDGVYDSTTKGYYFGPVVSYRFDAAEWYLAAKYNRVYWEVGENNVKDKDDESIFTIEPISHNFSYYQINAGLSYWFTDSFNTDLSALCLKLEEQRPACVPMLGFGVTF